MLLSDATRLSDDARAVGVDVSLVVWPWIWRVCHLLAPSLLVAGAETGRSFRMGVVLDLEHPFQAALDMIAPAAVVPTAEGPPAPGSRGWLIHLDRKAVAITHVGFVEATGEGRAWGLVLHLLETSGQSSRCRIRFFRNPTWVRQTDFQGELIIDLSLDGDAVLIDLTPNELARVEVTLG